MGRKLTQDEVFAMGALIHQSGHSRVYWPEASWVGVCTDGHVNIAAQELPFCTKVLDGHHCQRLWMKLPEHDALLAAFKIGGWDALVEAAKAVIASSEGG